jgi:SAM-dependent methyltransferase
MSDIAEDQASLEAVLKNEIVRMYQEVADNPKGEYHFFHGREAAEMFGYAPELLDRAPAGSVDSFAGVGNPHERSNLQPGPAMCQKAQAHAAATGSQMECHEGQMEKIPLPDASMEVIISNGVINLSFQKRRVVEEMFRVLKPGGRISITDIVSAKQLSQEIVNDPKLWAS